MLEDLHGWLTAQLADHLVEPNSSLGQAITHLLKHWGPLTLFLRQAGAPLDNNIVDAASGISARMPPGRLCRVRRQGRLPRRESECVSLGRAA